MPELPEVEGYRKYLLATAMQQRIVAVESENEGRMLPAGMAALRKASIGKGIISTERVGKYLFLQLGEANWMMWHFGLTGSPAYFTEKEAAPRFTRIWFELESGHYLGFVSMRKFSRLKLTDSVENFRKAHKIGPDALQATPE
ncbi:MAG: DNA-formamidopyrimidine glycosylase family protein, partial [Bacteroidota bacterium]